jgi:hypothetical protein
LLQQTPRGTPPQCARAGRVERAPHTPVGSLCEMLHIEEELHPAQRRGRFEAVATHVLDDAAQRNAVPTIN